RSLRYSNTQDMLRVFGAVLIFSILFLFVSFLFINPFMKIESINLFSILIINFFITSSLLIMLRICAKASFYFMIKRYDKKEITRVLIYGSDKNSVLIKQALENSSDVNYMIEGFIDVDRTRLNSYMEQKKVYHFKELSALHSKK